MASLVANLVRSGLGDDPRLSKYFSILEDITSGSPPSFATQNFGKQYRAGAINKPWFASLLLNDADMEGYSALQLWHYSDRTSDTELKSGLQRHAKDEARHAGMFGALLINIFPAMDTQEVRDRLRGLRPRLLENKSSPAENSYFSMDSLVNTAVLINLHEIKALVLEKLLHPLALAHSSDRARSRSDAILTALTNDEVEHIRYSAVFLERMLDEGYASFIPDAMSEFLDAVNEVTSEEVDTTQDIPQDLEEAFTKFDPVSDLIKAKQMAGA